MKLLHVLAAALLLFGSMGSSVRFVAANSDPTDPTPKVSGMMLVQTDPDDPVPRKASGTLLVDDGTLNPAPGSDIEPDHKATPVLL
jgi:hypothetical protein